jgi:dUTP pyrophosphatase
MAELNPDFLNDSPSVPVVAQDGATMPAYAHVGDAGSDLVTLEDVTLNPGRRATVGTGLHLALPPGHVGFITPRSGLAARHGITVLNAPGTVDASYRGEIRVTLLNTDPETPVVLHAGDRIAQLVVQRVTRVDFQRCDALPADDSTRGTGGFGSTGGAAVLGNVGA